MINFIKMIFSQFDSKYLLRTYLIGVMIFILMYSQVPDITALVVYFVICLLLFPLCTIVYDSIIELFFGNYIFSFSIVIALIFSVIKFIILFVFTPLVAPIGLAYLYFRR